MANTIQGLLPTGRLPTTAEAQVRDLIQTDAPPPDLTGYATTEYVDGEIAAIPTPDMSAYAPVGHTHPITDVNGLDAELSDLDARIGAATTAYEVAVQNGFEGTVQEWLASLQGERGVEGPYGGTEVTDPQVASWIGDPSTETGAKLDAAYRDGISVREHGATGDGTTDDTVAFEAAIVEADGATVVVPSGRYVIDHLVIDRPARLRLDDGAVLLAGAPSSTNRMIQMSGGSLMVTGGTIDGRREAQTGRPRVVFGDLRQGSHMIFRDVHFKSFFQTALLGNVGGYIEYDRCSFTDQAEHSGVNGEHTTILSTGSGEAGSHAFVRFTNNRAVWEGEPSQPSSNPGGIFLNSQLPGQHTGDGQPMTVDASHNHFDGYGQNAGGNDISPIHTYPAPGGMRVIGNYFRRFAFPAISAKSCDDVVITGNVLVDGVYSTQHHSSEGAISYVPGYHAKSFQRRRAVISGNVITNPGGESVERKQIGIAVKGALADGVESTASDVLVTGNVLYGCRMGVSVQRAHDVKVTGNIIEAATDGNPNTEHGVHALFIRGRLDISGNEIRVGNGHGIDLFSDLTEAQVTVKDNEILSESTGYGIRARGMALLKLTGNTIESETGAPVYVAADGAGNPVGHLIMDESNTLLGASPTIVYDQVTAASGQLVGKYTDPTGTVTPAQQSVTYRNATGGPLYIATGATSDSWAILGGGPPAVERTTDASIVYGTNSSGGPLNRTAGTRDPGNIPVYRAAGDLRVANAPEGAVSATSRTWVETQLADLEARITGIDPGGASPSISAGSAAGNGATATIEGTDRAGTITINPGTDAGNGGWATVTFGQARSQAPAGVILAPANGTAAAATAPRPFPGSLSSTGFIMSVGSATGSVSTQPHVWTYQVI